jgi:hypothetical protein
LLSRVPAGHGKHIDRALGDLAVSLKKPRGHGKSNLETSRTHEEENETNPGIQEQFSKDAEPIVA